MGTIELFDNGIRLLFSISYADRPHCRTVDGQWDSARKINNLPLSSDLGLHP